VKEATSKAVVSFFADMAEYPPGLAAGTGENGAVLCQ